jgi:aminopeptidase N
MAPPNLTRTDAERRAALLEVVDYAVELDLTDGGGKPGDTTFATSTRRRARRSGSGPSWWWRTSCRRAFRHRR